MSKHKQPTVSAAKRAEGARLLIDFLNSGLVPDFITDAALLALQAAADLKGIELWHGKDNDTLNPPAVAKLIAVTGGNFRLPEPPAEDEPGADYADFAAHVARVVMHPQTPKALRSALQAIAVNIISNESGYEWCSDGAGLRFIEVG